MSVGQRVVFIGDTEVGKTSIVKRMLNNDFSQENGTIGAVYYSYTTEHDNKQITMQIWDTAGQEKYRSIGSIYYRNAFAAIAVYDLTRKTTLDNLASWIDEYRKHSNDDFVIVVGNKQDLTDEIVFDEKETENWAKSMKAECIWVSAKTGIGIDDMVGIIANHLSNIDPNQTAQQIIISKEETNDGKKSCC